jgi:hypothetical protein
VGSQEKIMGVASQQDPTMTVGRGGLEIPEFTGSRFGEEHTVDAFDVFDYLNKLLAQNGVELYLDKFGERSVTDSSFTSEIVVPAKRPKPLTVIRAGFEATSPKEIANTKRRDRAYTLGTQKREILVPPKSKRVGQFATMFRLTHTPWIGVDLSNGLDPRTRAFSIYYAGYIPEGGYAGANLAETLSYQPSDPTHPAHLDPRDNSIDFSGILRERRSEALQKVTGEIVEFLS